MHSIDLQYDLHHEDGGAAQHYFIITREMLAEVVETNRTDALQRCGGIDNIVSALRTNLDVGIVGDQRDLHLRRQAFGSNFTPQRRCRSPHTIKYIKHLLSHVLRDTTILLLLCCAMLSLAIGIKTDGAAEIIRDGIFLMIPISFVVCFGALARFFRARWSIRKSLMKLNNKIWVVRNGAVYEILESELVVGDIVCLQVGDRVPADGLLIDGDTFGLDKTHPSLFTGGKVDKGQCRMLVTSVGENTERSRLIRSIGINAQTPLLDSIEKANSKLERVWLSLSLILLSVQFVRCFMMRPVQAADKDSRSFDPRGVKTTMEDLMKESIHLIKKERLKANYSLVTMLCVLLFASREGLPLAVFISLMYGSIRMKSAHAIVHQIQASAAVGLITTICTCETADLGLHHARMGELWIGFDLVRDHLNGKLDRRILDILREGILVHSPPDGCLEETSLLTWARAELGCNMEFLLDSSMVRNQCNDLCSVVMKGENEADKVMRVHWKGAPHLILSMCSHYYTVDGEIEALDDTKTAAFLQIVSNLVGCSQCCFAFAYKRVIQEEEEEKDEDLESRLTLLGFVSLKNPYSPQLMEAITDCRSSGVEIKLFVDGDITTARIMAVNSGLVRREDDAGAVVEAADFRSSSKADRMKMADNIQVMANASPADKLLMIQCLRQKHHVVAAAAAAIRDSPLLKEADVGLFMGGASEMTEVSKEDGDIMIPSGEFSQIPGIVNLGRRVCRNLEKFVQLQLTMEISAFSINMISLASTRKEAVSSFQVVWIYLIVGILGGMGVAITRCTSADPVYGSGRVVNRAMCRSIALQSLFQVAVVLIMVMKGKALFHVEELELQTMVFNSYAFCQVFLLIPAMEWKRKDVVAGMFLVAVGILQAAMVEIMGFVSHGAKLELKQWCVCIGIASFSLLLNCIFDVYIYIFVSK